MGFLTEEEFFELLEGIRMTNDACDKLDGEEGNHDCLKVKPISSGGLHDYMEV